MIESRRWFGILVPLGMILGAAASWHTAARPATIGIWAVAIAIGQSIEVPSGPGERIYLGVGVGVAALMVLDDGWAAAAVLAYGSSLAALLAAAATPGSRTVTSLTLAELYALAAFLAASYPVHRALAPTALDRGIASLLAVAAGGAAWFLARTTVRAFTGSQAAVLSVRFVWMRSLRNWPPVVAVFTSGALFGLLLSVFGWWAVPTTLFHYGVAYIALRRYHGAERTYRQLIRAFSGIVEVAGFSAPGHAAATADLVAGMARSAGMRPAAVDRLEQAALLHDVGLLTLSDPAVASAGHTDEEIAGWGAAIIGEAAELGEVARIVRLHARPYRRKGEESDPGIPREARFLRAAGAFDRAVRGQGATIDQALEYLHLNAAYDYDPDVVRLLRRLLVRRGELPGDGALPPTTDSP